MGPEEDLLGQVKKALKQVPAPVYYDGKPHKAEFPQIIIDLSNGQDQPRDFKAIEKTKLTVSIDIYALPEQLGERLNISNQVRNVMKSVRCAHWWSDFDSYSERTLDDEIGGDPLKRTAFLFDYMTYGVAIKKGGN